MLYICQRLFPIVSPIEVNLFDMFFKRSQSLFNEFQFIVYIHLSKLGVPLFFCYFVGLPECIWVYVLRWCVGWKQDFFVDDFVLVGIIFLFLIVLRKEPLSALVDSGSNGELVVAMLDNFYVIVCA